MHFQSPGAYPITWWSIFNEYNINNLSPSDYVSIYNAVVPAMLAVDPTIKLSAVELADYDYQAGDPRNNLPTILAAPGDGGISGPADVLSMHLFAACSQADTDVTAFSKVSAFASDLRYFYAEAATRPDLGAPQVWVTANNVDPDSPDPNGNSSCNPSHAYIPDARGTSPFFAAWGPYVFSVLGKAGARALYHWQYRSDSPFNPQYDEFNGDSDTPTLAYWVDRTLGRLFPSIPGAPGPSILQTTVSEPSAVEVLATKADSGLVTVLVVDRAVNTPEDNNGPGASRRVMVDVSGLGAFKSATRLVLDSTTDVTKTPAAGAIAPASPVVLSFGGYGAAFLVMSP
jgi:hypothetical protein